MTPAEVFKGKTESFQTNETVELREKKVRTPRALEFYFYDSRFNASCKAAKLYFSTREIIF